MNKPVPAPAKPALPAEPWDDIDRPPREPPAGHHLVRFGKYVCALGFVLCILGVRQLAQQNAYAMPFAHAVHKGGLLTLLGGFLLLWRGFRTSWRASSPRKERPPRMPREHSPFLNSAARKPGRKRRFGERRWS